MGRDKGKEHMDIDVSIIVPCLNHLPLTIECLQSIKNHTPEDKYAYEVIVVDDGSDDETEYYMEDRNDIVFENFIYIRHKTNLGFSSSVNDGIKAATGQYVAIFNNDIIVTKGWLDPLVEVMEWNNEVGMVTGTLFTNKSDLRAAMDNRNELDTRFNLWEKQGPWLFRKSVFEDIGVLDEQFNPAYYEDDDILVRMCLSKWIFGRVDNSISFHYLGATRKGELLRREGEGYYEANYLKFCVKWGLDTDSRFSIIYDKTYEANEIKYIKIPREMLYDEAGIKTIMFKPDDVYTAVK
jgi:GT2 family glycosyltransferase